MLIVRILMLLLLPVRWPIMLFSRLARRGRNADHAAAAPAVGGVGRAVRPQDLIDVRNGVFFKIFTCPDSDEPTLGPNDLPVATQMADRAHQFYKLRADLFPRDDIFYEQVEEQFIDQVSRIDNAGEKDQFLATLDSARKITNDNTRTLFCEIAPLILFVLLAGYAAMLLVVEPIELTRFMGTIASEEATRLAVGGMALGAGVIFASFIYWFSYTHIQRANALSLNVFITTEFARLNNAFRVAQREALQAETQLADTQKDELRRLSSSWTLAYHWIGVRLFLEEMIVRNTMFQVRRNTTLYRVLGVLICVGILFLVSAGAMIVPQFLSTRGSSWLVLPHLLAAAGLYTFVIYALTMRKPFAIIATSLMKDQWYRFDTLAVGDAIAEQVTRDKVQIVINRDRARAAGV
ncbi:MAG: hypothetical protein DCF16_00110 [Alphaproteobacteria bacterium]|nr:MAG: hypothetical protein DCF16_00110 [Alphaproteobacteria bacterium]